MKKTHTISSDYVDWSANRNSIRKVCLHRRFPLQPLSTRQVLLEYGGPPFICLYHVIVPHVENSVDSPGSSLNDKIIFCLQMHFRQACRLPLFFCAASEKHKWGHATRGEVNARGLPTPRPKRKIYFCYLRLQERLPTRQILPGLGKKCVTLGRSHKLPIL